MAKAKIKSALDVISENVDTLFSVTKKGTAQWCQVLEVDQYGNFGTDLYLNDEDTESLIETLEELRDTAQVALQEAGHEIKNIADVYKIKDGKKCFSFKSKPDQLIKQDGKVTIINVYGEEDKDWKQLVGNGSLVKVGFMARPYLMASTKSLGVALRFTALQVIKLQSFSRASSGFGDESSEEVPKAVKKVTPKVVFVNEADEGDDDDF